MRHIIGVGLLVLLTGFTTVLSAATSEPRTVLGLNPGWRFWLGEAPPAAATVAFADREWDLVSLPHTFELFPADLSGFAEHGRNLGWYRRTVEIPTTWSGRRVFLEFHGAMQTTKLWVNGAYVGEYAVSGYDSFSFDITAQIRPGRNLLAVRVDNTPNPDIPPDIRKTDFIQFGGLYRDVLLVATSPVHITFPWEAEAAGIRLTAPLISAERAVLAAATAVRNDDTRAVSVQVITEVRDHVGKVVTTVTSSQDLAAGATTLVCQECPAIATPHLWSPADPYLYRVVSMVQVGGTVVDRIETRYGVRWLEFTKDRGFFLNGQPLKLIGANRHQTWPYIGGAVPHSLHRLDAELLKRAGFNWVRLSHYPHDPYFLDQLDELGLLALEEGPTWWGKGTSSWVANLEKSFRAMIRRDRNHPALMIWNTCVNHGGKETFLVNAARDEDPTRARGQDTVPCPMNFDHPKVSGGGALTIEHTGHTFATHRGEPREYELAKRHWEMVDAAYRKPDNCGLAVWAMFDYNTFHNADGGIAYHGVYDLFRLPKHTAWWHQSELTATPMVHVVRVDPTTVCVFSNAAQVRLSQQVAVAGPSAVVGIQAPDAGFALHHPPFHFQVAADAVAFRAEGLVAGTVVASGEWRQPGQATTLTLTGEHLTLQADGADLSRLVVTAVDAAGTAIDQATTTITATIQGHGQIIGENPVPLRAGKMILLVQSGFVPGPLTVTVSGEGLKPATLALTMVAPPDGVDVPRDLPGLLPTRSKRVVIPPSPVATQASWMTFDSQVTGAQGTWVESGAILVPKEFDGAAVSIRGGEYRIYTGAWTSTSGTVRSGDAVYVRINVRRLGPSWADDGKPDFADLTIGTEHGRFAVTPKK
jgi:beta-galactosidase